MFFMSGDFVFPFCSLPVGLSVFFLKSDMAGGFGAELEGGCGVGGGRYTPHLIYFLSYERVSAGFPPQLNSLTLEE